MVYKAVDFSSESNNIECDCELGAVGKVEAKFVVKWLGVSPLLMSEMGISCLTTP